MGVGGDSVHGEEPGLFVRDGVVNDSGRRGLGCADGSNQTAENARVKPEATQQQMH